MPNDGNLIRHNDLEVSGSRADMLRMSGSTEPLFWDSSGKCVPIRSELAAERAEETQKHTEKKTEKKEEKDSERALTRISRKDTKRRK